MKRRYYLLLWVLGLALALLASTFQSVPGYMDAEYYYIGGVRLAQGEGFTEPYLWNYLNDPAGLPAPAFAYWMPLPSILAALGMGLAGSTSFFAARLVFLLLASLLPPLTALLSWRLARRERGALLAGVLAAFSGFYLQYTGLVETVTLYMLLGGSILLLAFEREWNWLERGKGAARFALLGLLAGLMHMSRADGLQWLAAVLLVALIRARNQDITGFWAWMGKAAWLAGSCLVGYALVTFPWYARNVAEFGSLMPPGNGLTLWITNYDQTFNYPAESLTMARWLEAGLGEHLRARWDALGANLSTVLGMQGGIALLPLIFAGLWRLRGDGRARLGAGMWGLTLLVMTLVFPFAGPRGGFLHSGGAVQVLLWAVAPEGLQAFIDWGARKRGWRKKRSERIFSVMVAEVMVLLTVGMFYFRVIQPEDGPWDASYQAYVKIDEKLDEFGAGEERVVMVNNPPGYYLASGHATIVIPNGDAQILLAVARRYGADYLALEESHVQGLDDLYLHPKDLPGLDYLGGADGVEFFRLEP